MWVLRVLITTAMRTGVNRRVPAQITGADTVFLFFVVPWNRADTFNHVRQFYSCRQKSLNSRLCGGSHAAFRLLPPQFPHD